MDPRPIIEELFEHGGALSGGAAVALFFRYDFSKDLDFFFKNDKYKAIKEEYGKYPFLDICLYKNQPYESFDLDITQCYVDPNGDFYFSEKAKKAYESKTCGLIRKNVVYPGATLRRLQSYAGKYNLEVNLEDLEFLRSLINGPEFNK